MSNSKGKTLVLRSLEGVEYLASRVVLAEASQVFQDMFAMEQSNSEDSALDMAEPSESLSIFVSIVHNPPSTLPFPSRKDPRSSSSFPGIVPFAHLQQLLEILVPKYQLSERIITALWSHLAVYSEEHPLEVYSLACSQSNHVIAALSSRHLLSPLHAYTPVQIQMLPSSAAYHNLMLLHKFRIERLSATASAEVVFPFDYGVCPSHLRDTRRLWTRRTEEIVQNMTAGTDVAEEMSTLLDMVKNCPVCTKGCTTAIEMLRYKCAKIPCTIDRIPGTGLEEIDFSLYSTS